MVTQIAKIIFTDVIKSMIINNYNPVINFQSNKRYYKAGPYNETIGTQTVVNREDLDFKNTAKIILKLQKLFVFKSSKKARIDDFFVT